MQVSKENKMGHEQRDIGYISRREDEVYVQKRAGKNLKL